MVSGIFGRSEVCVGSEVMVWSVGRVSVCLIDGTKGCKEQTNSSTELVIDVWANFGNGIGVFEGGGLLSSWSRSEINVSKSVGLNRISLCVGAVTLDSVWVMAASV